MLAPVFHREMVPVLEYLPEDVLFVVEDPEGIWEEARRTFGRLRESGLDAPTSAARS